MQNIHTHVWDQSLHFQEQTVRESDLSRGYRLDLTVRLEDLLEDTASFDRVVVFGLKGRLTGYWVPDEYVAGMVARIERPDPATRTALIHKLAASRGLELSAAATETPAIDSNTANSASALILRRPLLALTTSLPPTRNPAPDRLRFDRSTSPREFPLELDRFRDRVGSQPVRDPAPSPRV